MSDHEITKEKEKMDEVIMIKADEEFKLEVEAHFEKNHQMLENGELNIGARRSAVSEKHHFEGLLMKK